MYRPYMSASALSDVVDRHEKLAAKGHLLHEQIRSNIAPVLQTRAMNARPTNRWNPTNGKMSLLKRTTGNIFFDYVRVAVVSLIVQLSHPLPSDLSCSIRRLGTVSAYFFMCRTMWRACCCSVLSWWPSRALCSTLGSCPRVPTPLMDRSVGRGVLTCLRCLHLSLDCSRCWKGEWLSKSPLRMLPAVSGAVCTAPLLHCHAAVSCPSWSPGSW
jgi:hypothetical protein